MKFFLQVKADTTITETISNNGSVTISLWFWIALLELIIILLLFWKLNKKQNNLKFGDISKDKMKNAKRSDIDMENLMNSINGSRDLYKQLSRTCHPDKFINTDIHKIAEEIFQEVSKDKRNYNKLIALKQRAEMELNINFK